MFRKMYPAISHSGSACKVQVNFGDNFQWRGVRKGRHRGARGQGQFESIQRGSVGEVGGSWGSDNHVLQLREGSMDGSGSKYTSFTLMYDICFTEAIPKFGPLAEGDTAVVFPEC